MSDVIGVFDSGVGGLSVLRQLHALLPAEKFLYVADTAYMPYGCKPAEVVRQRAIQISDFFVKHGAKAIVVACNTATAVAIDGLRMRYQFPIIGMEPAIKPAVAGSRSGIVGVLATRGTVTSGKFSELQKRFADQAELIVQPCAGLVELIEQGEVDGPRCEAMLRSFLEPMLTRGADALVLGCTHYPFVMPLIRHIAGDSVTILDTGEAVARQLRRQLHQFDLLADEDGVGRVSFFSSSDHAAQTICTLWQHSVQVDSLGF